MIDHHRFAALLSALTADQLRHRLDEMDSERAAVATLLRAASARARAKQGSATGRNKERPNMPIETVTAAQLWKLEKEEAVHRRKIERAIQDAQRKDMEAARKAERIGQIFALAVCLFIVSCGTAAIFAGHPVSGTVLGSGAFLLGLVNAFLKRREVD